MTAGKYDQMNEAVIYMVFRHIGDKLSVHAEAVSKKTAMAKAYFSRVINSKATSSKKDAIWEKYETFLRRY